MPAASTVKALISVALWEAVAAGCARSTARGCRSPELTPGDPDGSGAKGVSTLLPSWRWRISICSC